MGDAYILEIRCSDDNTQPSITLEVLFDDLKKEEYDRFIWRRIGPCLGDQHESLLKLDCEMSESELRALVKQRFKPESESESESEPEILSGPINSFLEFIFSSRGGKTELLKFDLEDENYANNFKKVLMKFFNEEVDGLTSSELENLVENYEFLKSEENNKYAISLNKNDFLKLKNAVYPFSRFGFFLGMCLLFIGAASYASIPVVPYLCLGIAALGALIAVGTVLNHWEKKHFQGKLFSSIRNIDLSGLLPEKDFISNKS